MAKRSGSSQPMREKEVGEISARHSLKFVVPNRNVGG